MYQFNAHGPQDKYKEAESAATDPVASTVQEPAGPNPSSHPTSNQPEPPNQAEETHFETFYLKRVTTEFADDLDKLRNASDFNERSIPILIEALKNTARTYSEEEKAQVMGRGR
ncbi:MAG: hypothetical protein Q9221_001118 [Calogaya cf. arnoldii]